MKNGDISNAAPKRLLVVSDTFIETTIDYTRKYIVLIKMHKHVTYDKIVLNRLYKLAEHNGITLELISYDLSQDDLELLTVELDRMGINPFRYATHFKNPQELMKELPYRPDVLGVVDVPSRKLQYGHWSLDIT